MARSSSSRILTDHEDIREWAESRGAKPTCVRGTGGDDDTGMIRLDFPGYSGERSLQPISWDNWFDKFEESNLALLVQDETAGGDQSNFNKLINRDTATQSRGRRRQSRRVSSNTSARANSGSEDRRRSTGSKRSSSRGGTQKAASSSRAAATSGTGRKSAAGSRKVRKAPRGTGSRSRAA